MIALFALSIFAVSLSAMPHDIYTQTGSEVNNTASFRGNFSSQEEKQKVQRDLADLMRKAISIGAEIPEISGFDDENATLFVKVNVNNTGERIANASDFYFAVNYQRGPGSVGVAAFYGSEAGVIVRLPESTYGLMPQRIETSDPDKDSFINSFGLTSYSGDCHGKIRAGESKECVITKSISSNNIFNGTKSSSQESQLIENDTKYQSPLFTETPSFRSVEGTYSNNKSGVQLTFPQGWKGSEIVQGNITFLVLSPQLSSPEGTNEEPLPYIMLQISHSNSSSGSQIPQNGSMALPLSFEDIVKQNDTDLSKKLGCNFTSASSENISLNETEGKELTYQCTYPSSSPTPPITTNGKAFAIKIGENQIIMAYNSLSSANFEKFLPEFDRALRSLKIQ